MVEPVSLGFMLYALVIFYVAYKMLEQLQVERIS